MRAHVQADAIRQTVRIDEAKLTPGIAAAELMLDWSGPHPRVKLSARTDGLDAIALHGWLAQSIDPARVVPGKLVRTIVAGVRASEGELAIAVGRLSAGRVALNTLDVAGGWRAAKARATIAARLGKHPLNGTLQADVRSDTLALAAEAGGTQLELLGRRGHCWNGWQASGPCFRARNARRCAAPELARRPRGAGG